MRRFDPALSCLAPLSDYPLLGPGGAQESFSGLPATAPFNIIELCRRSPSLRFTDVIRANMPPLPTAAIPVDRLYTDPHAPPGPDGRPPRGVDDFLLAGGPNIINLIKVAGEQQVVLRVTVAEVSRAAARSIGLNFNVTGRELGIANDAVERRSLVAGEERFLRIRIVAQPVGRAA